MTDETDYFRFADYPEPTPVSQSSILGEISAPLGGKGNLRAC